MARGIVINRRRGILNRRSVLDTGGASCCCGGFDCPCSPEFPIVSSAKYIGCVPGSAADTTVLGPIQLPPFRRMTVTGTFAAAAYESREGPTVTNGGPYGTAYETGMSVTGHYSVCWFGLNVAMRLSAQWSWFYRTQDGTGFEDNGTADESGSAYSTLPIPPGYPVEPILPLGRLVLPRWTLIYPRLDFIGGSGSPRFGFFNGAMMGFTFPSPGLQRTPIPNRCDWSGEETDTQWPNGAYAYRQAEGTYADSPVGGAMRGRGSSWFLENRDPYTMIRTNGSQSSQWSRALSMCDGSGGGDERPGGCSGCGRPEALVPI